MIKMEMKSVKIKDRVKMCFSGFLMSKLGTLLIILTLNLLSYANAKSAITASSPKSNNSSPTRSFSQLRESFLTEQETIAVQANTRIRQSIKNNEPIFTAGGWNGTGGGGGYACFKNKSDLENFRDQDGLIKNESYEKIVSFQLLDLYQMVSPVQWSENDITPKEFIENRIRTRITPISPILSDLILSHFKMSEKKWSYIPFDLPIHDQGAPQTIIAPPPLCGYVTWVMRPQYIKEQGPIFFLAANSLLEKRLKEILSPVEFEQQKQTLKLHEAIYTILSQFGERDSNNTRGLVEISLRSEENIKSNSNYLQLWLRGLNSLLLHKNKEFFHFISKKISLDKNDESNIKGLEDHLEWLSRMDDAYAKFGQYLSEISTGNGSVFIDVDDMSNSNSRWGRVVLQFQFLAMAIVKAENNGEKVVHDRSTVLFLNSVLPFNELPLSSEELSLSLGSDSKEWQEVCRRIKLPKTKNDIDQAMGPSLLGVGKWVLDKALNFCRDIERATDLKADRK